TNNCGSCGKACPPVANGTAACTAGNCTIASCDARHADCNQMPDDGCETSTATDARNCGACNMMCPGGPNATPACVGGACTLQGTGGRTDCDNNAANGCETSTDTDINNCGTCGHACGATPHGVLGCVAGACAVVACDAGWTDCNKGAVDGCEIQTA